MVKMVVTVVVQTKVPGLGGSSNSEMEMTLEDGVRR